jgi:aquaporin Z
MEAGEAGLYLFSACTVATLLWHPASPVRQAFPSAAVRRMLMGLAMGATIIAIVGYSDEGERCSGRKPNGIPG